jgi:hypothetical protein
VESPGAKGQVSWLLHPPILFYEHYGEENRYAEVLKAEKVGVGGRSCQRR